ncbi:MAG: hypothetical protein IT578_09825 [Verrucomicrobiae bacterium]|nr:hypothetical protein [Verrucomicrobiae bacterium]
MSEPEQKTAPDQPKEGDPDLLEKSTLYREFLAEKEEILRHKWIESEKVGHDIGFERALLDWIIKYRAGWRKQRRQSSS